MEGTCARAALERKAGCSHAYVFSDLTAPATPERSIVAADSVARRCGGELGEVRRSVMRNLVSILLCWEIKCNGRNRQKLGSDLDLQAAGTRRACARQLKELNRRRHLNARAQQAGARLFRKAEPVMTGAGRCERTHLVEPPVPRSSSSSRPGHPRADPLARALAPPSQPRKSWRRRAACTTFRRSSATTTRAGRSIKFWSSQSAARSRLRRRHR